MIVTCPACHVRYQVAQGAIGTKRRVRCTHCHHVWTESEDVAAPLVPQTPAAVMPGGSAFHSVAPRNLSPSPLLRRLGRLGRNRFVLWGGLLAFGVWGFSYGLDHPALAPYVSHIRHYLFPKSSATQDLQKFLRLKKVTLRSSPSGGGPKVSGVLENVSQRVQDVPVLKLTVWMPVTTHHESKPWRYQGSRAFYRGLSQKHRLSQKSLLPGEILRWSKTFHESFSKKSFVTVRF